MGYTPIEDSLPSMEGNVDTRITPIILVRNVNMNRNDSSVLFIIIKCM